MAYNKNKNIIINSDMMKIVIASHFRYRLKYKYTCTEYNFMDVCACNKKKLTEIEVKISKSDLKNDSKKWKHSFYSGEYKKGGRKIIPNKFYYAITDKLYRDPECVKFIKNLNENYGIIVISDWREPYFAKRAKSLHTFNIEEKFLNKIIDRITSENICLRKKLYELKLKFKK